MSDFRTWDQLSELEQLQSMYSDLFKDVNGFRPRGSWVELPLDALKAEYDSLLAYGEVVWAREKADEQHAVAVVESRLADMVNLYGAKDRETAVRWLMESEDVDGDAEYLCYKLGIPYGYFKKVA